jgi:hypothetical protein
MFAHVDKLARVAALLAILALPVACDRGVTAPERPSMAAHARNALLTLPRLTIPDFDNSQYFSIDVQRAAQQQYGSSATAVLTFDHLYGWKASVGGSLYGIDMKRAVADEYGSGYVLAAVGLGGYDWRAVHWSALANRVLPVMPVGSDQFFNVSAARSGMANFQSVLLTIRNWYKYRTGESFHYLQPLIVPVQSTMTSAQWNTLASSSNDPNHRYDFMNAAINEYRLSYPALGSALRAVIVPFTGASPDAWLGAASTGSYAVEAPRGSSITCPASGALDDRCADATYAIGHELGHTFGLQHSCDAYPSDPNCANSIMQVGKPWDAILLSGEISTLTALPFFW